MMFIMSASVLLLLAFPSVISEVVDFSECSEFFYKGQSPVIPGILENSRSQDNRYKTICQKYTNKYRFGTLYDTTNRIPVFSAYKFTSENTTKRPHLKWMGEPQLEPPSDEMGVPYENQATDDDYVQTEMQKHTVNRGHLFPCCHAVDPDTARSTFTYTNIVPQKISFNSGSWNRMERETIKVMSEHCRDKMDQNNVLAHVLTGAVHGINKLNERVNIPSFMWMTFCCYKSSTSSWSSQAYWAPNQDEKINNVTIAEIRLERLQELLSTEWVNITQLFTNNCTENLNISIPLKVD
ncbi:endonuclease domain-containing 1 protein-like [Triplophysa rosa]|uniref:Endonuclease domain-containing 1 protein-like n=1 Tax=Triplophysa rosa TaxID=992332 RepID=A0A9W7TH42_TRIRA|nr:endonuclease domain-containing 1 protein-like [Triplophysa rosa]KAI7798640.1 putative endonuclease domain-containing 1 protein-like [Triplophysa rosa]